MHTLDDWVRYGDEIRRPLMIANGLEKSSRVAIIGAGLSGLTIAYRIAKRRPDIEIELHEKTEGVGGVISTWKKGDWVCDIAVNAVRPHPAFWRLVEDLDISDKFSQSNIEAKSRWIFLDGKKVRLSAKSIFRIGPIKLISGINRSRLGGKSVREIIPHALISDAMTLGIVNDLSDNVDADFLMPNLTKFGENPPIKWSKIKKMMRSTYPIFLPTKGSVASFSGGMQTLIDSLYKELEKQENVKIIFGSNFENATEASKKLGLEKQSIIWSSPPKARKNNFTELKIYAVGYDSEQCQDIPVGYGTLIPNQSISISGILHESDVHSTNRAPPNHRLFRVMSPNSRGASEVEVKEDLKKILCKHDPVLFECIGERRIPKYPPGYMGSLDTGEAEYTRSGWFFSGVSITHVVAEAERIAERF